MFSVVIPVYNHARYLVGAVRSALASPLVHEVLLVDDGSKDGSAELCARLAVANPGRVRDLTTGYENVGAHNRLNQLCRAATGPWIAVLNSDDEFISGRFDAMRAAARAHAAELVAGTIVIMDDAGVTIGRKRELTDPEYPMPERLRTEIGADYDTLWMRRGLSNQNFVATTSNIVFTKALFDRIGGFEDLRYAHDWAFLLRASMTANVCLTAQPCTRYRLHANNTIKEVTGHVDGEITRFFAEFLHDHPDFEQDELCRVGLAGNRHIADYSPPERIWLIETGQSGDRQIASRTPTIGAAIPPHGVAQALLALAHRDYDFIIVSDDLTEPPEVSVGRLSAHSVYNAKARGLIEDGIDEGVPLVGRIIRAMPSRGDTVSSDLRTLPGFAKATLLGSDVGLNGDPAGAPLEPAPDWPLPASMPMREERQRILVLPIFLAVGGAERNMIEVLGSLSDEFDFLVVSSEHLSRHHGSLHFELEKLGIGWFDLAEVAERDDHLAVLHTIIGAFQADAVWICNGSPWLVENYAALRRMLHHTPIIDQQVYDTDHGWINEYQRPAIQSADRFIAGTQKIYDVFLHRQRIPQSRVDVIYHAMPVAGIEEIDTVFEQRDRLRSELSVPPAGRIYAFIGRLTPQKRPIDFLDLAARSQAEGRDEHFVLIGSGELAADCDAAIAQRAIDNVTRIPFVKDLRIAAAICDGMIMTSAYEGLSIALLQMLAMGRPVLSTDVGDTAAILEDYGSGAIIPAIGDADVAWSAFRDWADHLDEYADRAVAARARVIERFSPATIGAQYAASWRSAIEGRTGRRV